MNKGLRSTTLCLMAFFSLAFFSDVKAVTTLPATQGGTGINTTTAANIGRAIVVSSTNPLVYKIASSTYTETDPIWSAFLLNPIFINLTSTNFFATSSRILNLITTNVTTTNANLTTITFGTAVGISITSTNLYISGTSNFAGALTFTTANGTSITSTNAFFTALATTNFTVTNLTATNLTSTNGNFTNLTFANATGTNISSTNAYFNQLGVGGNPGLAQMKIVTPAGLVDAVQVTDNSNYTFDMGFDSVNGGAFFGGLAGSPMSIWANGGMVMRLTLAGKVGIGTAAPTAKLSVSGDFDVSATTTLNATTTVNGPLGFGIASGTSITSTNAFFTNLRATTLNLTNLVATNLTSTNGNISALTFTTANGTSITSTNASFTTLTASNVILTSLNTTNLTSTNGYIPSLVFVSATGTNFFATSSRMFNVTSTNATTTNQHIRGQLNDRNGSPGSFGNVYVTDGTSTLWINIGISCTPISGDCTLVDFQSWFVVSGATGCSENSVIYKDDSTFTCNGGFLFHYAEDGQRFEAPTMSTTGLLVNGDTTTTNLAVLGNLAVRGSLTLNSLILTNIFSQNVYVSSTLVLYSATGTDTTMFFGTLPTNQTTSTLDNISDPYCLPGGTATANVTAIYSDDLTRIPVVDTGSNGTISIKNGTLVPANTLQSGFYSTSGVLQSTSTNGLMGNLSTLKGCVNSKGYLCCVGRPSGGADEILKCAVSNWGVDIKKPASWATMTGQHLLASGVGLIGVLSNGDLAFATSSTEIVPLRMNFGASTYASQPSYTIATGNINLADSRVNSRPGCPFFINQASGPPFTLCFDENGNQSNQGGGRSVTAPSATGPTMFATPYSMYLVQGAGWLCKQRI